jgi:hypothetical protein
VLLLSPPHHYPGKNQNDNDDDGGDGHPIELHRGAFSCCEMETTAGLYNALRTKASETVGRALVQVEFIFILLAPWL